MSNIVLKTLKRIKYFLHYFIKKRSFRKAINQLYDDVLLISHLGGGTSFYDNKTYKKNYIKICPSEHKKFYLAFVSRSEKNEKIFFIKTNELKWLFSLWHSSVHIGSLYGYNDIPLLINLLVSYKKNNEKSHFTYLVHDYHSICPTTHLLSKDYFCQFRCNECNEGITIHKWREMWLLLFNVVDEIVCFSKSSKTIIQSIYYEVEKKIIVRPHDVSYVNTYKRINTSITDKKRIGIVGNISNKAKGLFVVRELLTEFASEKVQFIMIGSSEKTININNDIVKYLGTYEREDLYNILVREKISCIVFPSVVPETFSFLLSELIALGIPIIAFKIGAQEEKLVGYTDSVLVNDIFEMKRAIKQWITE